MMPGPDYLLPRAEALPAPGDPAPSVLVIDDDPDTRAILRDLLESRGYRVEEAENAPEAETLFRRSLPTVVVSEWVVPWPRGACVLDGGFLAEAPVVVIWTCMDTPEVRTRVEASGALYLRKPLPPARVLMAIERALQGDRPEGPRWGRGSRGRILPLPPLDASSEGV